MLKRTFMKRGFIAILLALVACCAVIHAREVTSFNDGWEFKKGPFAQDAMKVAQKWNAKWEKVTIPHTWNADSMKE